jgi:hypothetical protein
MVDLLWVWLGVELEEQQLLVEVVETHLHLRIRSCPLVLASLAR